MRALPVSEQATREDLTEKKLPRRPRQNSKLLSDRAEHIVMASWEEDAEPDGVKSTECRR